MEYKNKLFVGDFTKLSPTTLPDNSIDIVVTSPPYNESKDYDTYTDDLSTKEWLEFMREVLTECKRVLKPDGRICVNLADSGRSPMIPKPQLVMCMMYEMGFLLRGDIIWTKPGYNGCAWGSWKSPSNPAITDNSEHIIIASNEVMKKTGDRDDIDIEGDEFKEWITGIWDMSPSNNKIHPCVYPQELVKRCLKLYSYKGDVVLDPFMGSGTTALVAKELGRDYVGFDISEKYTELANSRLYD